MYRYVYIIFLVHNISYFLEKIIVVYFSNKIVEPKYPGRYHLVTELNTSTNNSKTARCILLKLYGAHTFFSSM